MNALLPREVRRDGSPADEFSRREAEIATYLERATPRFDAILAAAQLESPVLELGADPWLFTQLLLDRGLHVVTAGQRRGVWSEDATTPTPQRIELRWAGREHTLQHHLFNAERDRWPFDDGSFATVLCMEVVEHLVYSPSHVLYEASRVLAEGGILVVSTPNAVSGTNLARLLRRRNVHGPYSGYGAHGRHNREFTGDELQRLLRHAGFEPDVRLVNAAPHHVEDPLGGLLRRWPGRRDHIVAVARKTHEPALVFPGDLYRSVDRDRLREERVLLPDE